MMNFPGVLAGDDGVLAEISATLKTGKIVTGHYSVQRSSMIVIASLLANMLEHKQT